MTGSPPDPSGSAVLARHLLSQGRREEAWGVLEQGLARSPDHPALLVAAIEYWRAAGDLESSLRCSSRLMAAHPVDTRGYLRAADELVVLDRLEEAQAVIARGLERAARRPLEAYGRNKLAKIPRLRARNPLIHEIWTRSKRLPTPRLTPPPPDPSGSRLAGAAPAVIQYWSQGEPPADVRAISETWDRLLSRLGLAPIRLWSRPEAALWLAHHAPEHLPAFESAPHYASESDVFRLAYASRNDCLWIDADFGPGPDAEAILSRALAEPCSALLLAERIPYLQSSFFIARRNCPFFALASRQMSRFRFTGRRLVPGLIYDTYGPGLFNRTFRRLCNAASERRASMLLEPCITQVRLEDCPLLLVRVERMLRAMGRQLAYKNTTLAWQRFVGLKT